MLKTVELLQKAFPVEISDLLVDKIYRAYEVNFSCYDPSIGHDAMTFGLMVHKSKVLFINQLAEEDSRIRIIQRSPFFCFQIGEYRISTYRAGHSGEADITTSFPHNRTRAARITQRNRNQLSFAFMHDNEPDDSNCRELVLADIGNPQDGLCKVFIGVPVETTLEGRITKWGTTFTLWENDALTLATSSPSVEKPPVEEVVPPSLGLKENRQTKEGQ